MNHGNGDFDLNHGDGDFDSFSPIYSYEYASSGLDNHADGITMIYTT